MSDERIEQWLQKLTECGEMADMEKAHPLPDTFRPDCSPHEAELVSVILADLGQCKFY